VQATRSGVRMTGAARSATERNLGPGFNAKGRNDPASSPTAENLHAPPIGVTTVPVPRHSGQACSSSFPVPLHRRHRFSPAPLVPGFTASGFSPFLSAMTVPLGTGIGTSVISTGCEAARRHWGELRDRERVGVHRSQHRMLKSIDHGQGCSRAGHGSVLTEADVDHSGKAARQE
jgi:hypothetical protein